MTAPRCGGANEAPAPTLKELLLSAEARTECLVSPRSQIRQRKPPDLTNSKAGGEG